MLKKEPCWQVISSILHLVPSEGTVTEVKPGEEGVDSVTFKLYYEKPVISRALSCAMLTSWKPKAEEIGL